MVDIIYQPPVDRTTYVITPSNEDSVSTATESPHVMQQKQALRDVIDDLNQESYEEHNSLYPNEEGQLEESYPEEQSGYENSDVPAEKVRKPRKKSKKNDSPNNYAVRKREEHERIARMREIEREEYQRELEQKEAENRFIEQAYRLKLEEKDIEKDIEKVSNVYLDAKKDQDFETELEATRVLHQLDQRRHDITRGIAQINEEVVAREPTQPSIEEQEYEAAIEAEFVSISDKRELKSPAYYEFLKKYPICNPYHEDYDQKLAREIFEIRNEEMRQLKIRGNSSLIGSDDYFDQIEQRIEDHFYDGHSSRRTNQRTTQRNNQYDEDQNHTYNEEEDMNRYGRDDRGPRDNRSGGGRTYEIKQFGDQYDEGYAPDYDPSFRKSSDFRDADGSFVNREGRTISRGAPEENPDYYRGPNQRIQRTSPRSAPTSPVSRDGYARDRRSNPRLDPVFDHQIQQTAIRMRGMVHPDGTPMKEQERIDYYRDYFANQGGEY